MAPLNIPDFDKPLSPNALEDLRIKEEAKFKVQAKQKPKVIADYLLRGTVFFTLSLLLIAAIYFVYNYAQDFLVGGLAAKEQTLVFENTLVRADRSRVVSLEAGASKESVRSVIVQSLLNERVNNGDISLIMPSYLRDTIVDGQRKLVAELQRGDDFFFTFAVRSPLNLRTISAQQYAVGTAGVGDVKQNGSKNFFVFSVSSAPDATREMLRYESQIYYDMKDVLKLRDLHGDFSFKDLSDNNNLLRVGYDDDGVVMVYGFGAPKTIIVAPDAQTFQMIYSHLK